MTYLQMLVIVKAKSGSTICLLPKPSPNIWRSYTSRQNGSIHTIQMIVLAAGCSAMIESRG
jgi:hypothetical protein